MGRYSGPRRHASYVSGWIKFALLGVIVSIFFQGALCESEPTESQCRPYIEKALKEQHLEVDERNLEEATDRLEFTQEERSPPTDELADSTEGSLTKEDERKDDDDDDDDDEDEDDAEVRRKDEAEEGDGNMDAKAEDDDTNEGKVKNDEEDDDEEKDDKEIEEIEVELDEDEAKENDEDEAAKDNGDEKEDEDDKEVTDNDNEEDENKEAVSDNDDDDDDSNLENPIDIEIQEIEIDNDEDNDIEETQADENDFDKNSAAEEDENNKEVIDKKTEIDDDTKEETDDKKKEIGDNEKEETEDDEKEEEKDKGDQNEDRDEVEKTEDKDEDVQTEITSETQKEEDDDEESKGAVEENGDNKEQEDKHDDKDDKDEDEDADELEIKTEKKETVKEKNAEAAEGESKEDEDQESPEEEELIKEMVIPENLRPRDHIEKILKLEDSGLETVLEKTIDTTLKALKGLYDNAIKPLEMLYKYRDLSNRHFGDPEIFSKPLVLFMGPWSGGKSSTINYLLDNEFSRTSLRTGAEPSPAYFNILMYGEEEEILDGTQLAADWTFSGLQKFGQSLLDRLKGIKLPNKLLEEVNIVEIPGILEIRKQVQRLFPFNDACQWFIDRADIIFLVYDPSKLDVGPETEAILDQLKGREYQTRIILNKADQVKPEELMRVQGTLIWNISPLMSSSEPPIMYSTSLWSLPYETGAPIRLLQAQERAFLKDLREAIDKRVENKIASARRFAVRVRNHAKMVDCYLTTYYNHKTIFGNRKKISDDIIEYPQKYHIYEGLSTLTNISRYDLPDPDVYRDFFKINPLYEFKKLSETCTYFRGCPINKLDVAIAYDLPELIGRYKKAVETAKDQLQKENS